MNLRGLSVASEVFPLIKTGGLADVAGALPAALAGQGVAMRTMLPGYPAVLAALGQADPVCDFGQRFGTSARLLAGRAAGLDLFVLDVPGLYARPGGPYTDLAGRDWPDNPRRFAALAQAACAVGLGAVPGFVPDIVHAHDWQAGLAPAYLHYTGGARPRTVMTVHNLAFQGWAEPSLLASLGLPQSAFTIDGVEFFGGIGFLKAGLRFADRLTTVSPGYAAEIQTAEGGMALDGLLRGRADVLSGIVNGIDTAVWDPAADALLPARFDATCLERRAINKAALQARMGLPADPGALLFGMVSRLTGQKGADLLPAVLPVLRRLGAQLAVLGSGEPALEAAIQDMVAASPGRVGFVLGYDEALAHLLQGGCDALLVPSRFEPCGLTQLCALQYGAVPVVARVGGLADTVIDANPAALAAGVATGVQFAPVHAAGLAAAIARTAALWRDQALWKTLQINGMAADVSWRAPAARYAALYRELATAPGPAAARLASATR